MIEFENNPISLEYLNKVQKARTFEYWKLLTEMDDKYKFGWSSSLSSLSSSSSSLSMFSSSWSSWSVLSQTDKDKYKKVYDRMISAKKRYEEADGKYI